MKSILLFAFSILLLSCHTGVDSNNTATIINANGIIHKLETSTWMYGTYTLDDSTGNPIYALTSSTIDLNNYENKSVKISGSLIAGYPVDGGPKYVKVTSVSTIR